MHRVTLVSLCSLMLLAQVVIGAPGRRPRQFGGPALTRAEFNRLAAQLGMPLFWELDTDKDGQIDPPELVTLLAPGGDPSAAPTDKASFTPTFVRQYKRLVQQRRLEAVRRELDAGRPTLVQTDLRKESLPIKRMLRRLLEAAAQVDLLYYRQTGGFPLLRPVRRADMASQALFRRNAGPWCVTPAMRNDPFCSALPDFPSRRSENYPTELAQDRALCATLAREPNGRQLLSPFMVVRRRGVEWIAVPYHRAYATQMRAVANKLRAAARELDEVPQEKALQGYLLGAAEAFTSGEWAKADEAWMRMTSDNSRWYLRVAPDEAYADPCRRKAAFHFSLARVDRRSRAWTRQLTPLRHQMEREAAHLAGSTYRPRDVRLAVPEFLHVVYNAGDSRHPLGATLGQSLPNWGPVARQGRGRTLVMTNLYRDADSKHLAQRQARELLAAPTLRHFPSSSEPNIIHTVLRETSHNFGPSADYRVRGRTSSQIFGVALAAILEQLQIECLSLRHVQLLQRRQLLTESRAREVYVKSLLWAFGQLARGLKSPTGRPRPHGQVAAVMLGALSEAEALRVQHGRFLLDFAILPAAIRGLAQRVLQIKARGDVRDARTLVQHYTGQPLLEQIGAARIRAVLKPYPKAHFRYAALL